MQSHFIIKNHGTLQHNFILFSTLKNNRYKIKHKMHKKCSKKERIEEKYKKALKIYEKP